MTKTKQNKKQQKQNNNKTKQKKTDPKMLNEIREIEAVFSQWASAVNDVCNFHIYNSKFVFVFVFVFGFVDTKTEIEAWTSDHFNNGCFVS